MKPPETYWTLEEVAAAFGLSRRTFCQRLPEFQREGFPMPLPWSRRERRYNPAAVLAWKARQELRLKAAPPQLRTVA